jgi:multiple sugar transport system ATP-binding protein
MATIELKQVEKVFGTSPAVKPMDLTIGDGEFVVLLGPSGCGKTTTLRMISGLEAVTGGKIFLNGEDVTWRTASQRDIAFVFQFFALYPHMTVRQNVSFPLESVGTPAAEREKRVDDVLKLLRIEHLQNRKPPALSGGDLQRVALARALVRNPSCFLMDEPLGALDAEFREAMRAEIKRLHLAQHATTVYVTHDQIEAMAMGDRIVVMSAAVVQQVGTPAEVYHNPTNMFVANFIGSPGMNLVRSRYARGIVHLPGGSQFKAPKAWRPTLDAQIGDGEVVLGFRPEAAVVRAGEPISATVYADDLHGSYVMLHVNLDEDTIVHIRARRDHDYALGETIFFDLDPSMVRFFDPSTQLALQPAEALATPPVEVLA